VCGRDGVQTVDWSSLSGRVIAGRQMDVRAARRSGFARVNEQPQTDAFGRRDWLADVTGNQCPSTLSLLHVRHRGAGWATQRFGLCLVPIRLNELVTELVSRHLVVCQASTTSSLVYGYSHKTCPHRPSISRNT